MRRAVFLLSIVTAACGSVDRHTPDAATHDGPVDAAVDAAGSNAMAATGQPDPSPRDRSLELGVLGLSLAVVLAPVGARRRRLAQQH